MFGQELLAYIKYGNIHEIIERDDGCIDLTSPKSYFSEFTKWPKIEKIAINLIQGPVLDIGCGPGRVGKYLKTKKIDVTNIDVSPIAIKICKNSGLKKSRVLSISDIEKLNYKNFNSIVLFGRNFGLLQTPKKAKLILSKIAKITNKDAIILGESRDPNTITNPAFIKYMKKNIKKNKMPGQLRLRLRYQTYKGNWFKFLYASKNDVLSLIDVTEWYVDRFIGHDETFIAVIKKRITAKYLVAVN